MFRQNRMRTLLASSIVEPLERRAMLDATLGGNGLLTVTGTDAGETITVAAAAGQVTVTIGAVAAGPFPQAAVLAVSVDALGGADTISLVNIGVPATLLGGAGVDVMNGGSGPDFAVGGTGNDVFNGNAGNDTFVWNPGDGNDVINGGADTDTHLFNGSAGDEIMNASPSATPGRVTFTRNLGNIVMDIGTFENLVVDALGGNDTLSATGNLAALISLTYNGGAGDDQINGSNGVDLLLGGDGDDVVDGNQGNDVAFLGEGDDTFIWDPGDGSDTFDGEAGFDTLLFNGSGADENFTAFAGGAGGSRLIFTRNVGNIVMDAGTTEKLDVRGLGGNDNTVIFDLSATPVSEVVVDGGAGEDSFAGSPLAGETFVGGEGNDTAIFGDGDLFEMGAGTDRLLFVSATDNVHVDARTTSSGDQQVLFRVRGAHGSAIFNDGEIVNVLLPPGAGDKLKVHKAAAELWDVELLPIF